MIVSASSTATSELRSAALSLAPFLKYQKQWIAHAKHACDAGFPLETVSICLNMIHAILRKGLLLGGQLESLNLPETLKRDRHFVESLTNPNDIMPRGVPFSELVGAAERFELIDAKSTALILILHEKALVLSRDLFMPEERDPGETSREITKLAQASITAAEDCLKVLEFLAKKLEKKVSK